MIPVRLSVVLPVRDERESLEAVWAELAVVLERIGVPAEALFVDDGSRDGSAEILDRMAGEDPRVRVVHLAGSFGQTAALAVGFRRAVGELVATLDADGQNDPADLPALLERIGECDAVVGYRVRRADPWTRRLASRFANRIRNAVTGDSVRDTGCSLKLFRREGLERIRLYDGMHRFLPTLLRMEGLRVREVPVRHRPRRGGRSKYTLGGRLVRTTCDLLAVAWMRRRRLEARVAAEPRPLSGRERNTRAV